MSNTPEYPKGDLRRMLSVLAAIDTAPEGVATIVSIAKVTGLARKTVTDLIDAAQVQAGVVICKEGPHYRIVDWGPVIKRNGAKMAFTVIDIERVD